VFCPKYRYRILKDRAGETVKQQIDSLLFLFPVHSSLSQKRGGVGGRATKKADLTGPASLLFQKTLE
jgi:hypothetical protein